MPTPFCEGLVCYTLFYWLTSTFLFQTFTPPILRHIFDTILCAAGYNTKFAARTRTKSKNGFWLYPVIKFMQAINGKNRKIFGRFSPCQYQRALHGAFFWMTEGRPVYLPDFLCGYIPPAVFGSIAESERNSKNYVRLFHVEASGSSDRTGGISLSLGPSRSPPGSRPNRPQTKLKASIWCR